MRTFPVSPSKSSNLYAPYRSEIFKNWLKNKLYQWDDFLARQLISHDTSEYRSQHSESSVAATFVGGLIWMETLNKRRVAQSEWEKMNIEHPTLNIERRMLRSLRSTGSYGKR